ncbi:MAG: hypothetical protein ACK41Q_08785 [Candidatus Brocadia sp.]
MKPSYLFRIGKDVVSEKRKAIEVKLAITMNVTIGGCMGLNERKGKMNGACKK